MLIHGVSQDSMILGAMVSLPKNKKKALYNPLLSELKTQKGFI